ncbi:MAG: hypothetical protein IKF17_05685 [Clostridia bacterium]|nr:hypothetical protein [Clostridia bacterium]
MVYKGYELIKAIENMEIEKGTRFFDNYNNEYKYKNYGSLEELDLVKIEPQGESIPDYSMFIDNEFTVIEEQQDIDIQEIEELPQWTTRRDGEVTQQEGKRLEMAEKINQLVQAVKQLDRNIKDKE